MAQFQDFYESLLPGNYALTKSMEFTRGDRCGTLWYLKKFLVVYYYIFLSDRIETLEYVQELRDAFDNYLSDLEGEARREAERFFYPDNPLINLRSEQFRTFSDFAGQQNFSNERARQDYLERVRKYYFVFLMELRGQGAVNRWIRDELYQPDFRVDRLPDIIEKYWEKYPDERGDNLIQVINDYHAALRNERQILYHYGFVHSRSATAGEFSSLTPMGELAMDANSTEFLCLWEHQKLKMVSQPVTARMEKLGGLIVDSQKFTTSCRPYLNLIQVLLDRGRLTNEEYQYYVARLNRRLEEGGPQGLHRLSGEVLPRLEEVKDKVSHFGRRSDVTSEDGAKELKKYLLGLRGDLRKDRGTLCTGCCALEKGGVRVTQRDRLVRIEAVYARLTEYKETRYQKLFQKCEDELRRSYQEGLLGRRRKLDGEVKLDWDLYNIHPEKVMLLGVTLLVTSLRLELRLEARTELLQQAWESCRGMLSRAGFRNKTEYQKEARRLLKAMKAGDYQEYLAEELPRAEAEERRQAGEEAVLWRRVQRESERGSGKFQGDRQRNMALVAALRAYYDSAGQNRCECCGEELDYNQQFHHLIPFGDGLDGPDHYLNLYGLCANCHHKFHHLPRTRRAELYAGLERNNRLEQPLLQRLKELRQEGLLRSYQLEFLLMDGAIDQRVYAEVTEGKPLSRGGQTTLEEFLNRIIPEDCRDVLPKLPRESVDLVVTSPPYDALREYSGESEWNMKVFRQVADQLWRVMKPGGVVVWVVDDRTTEEVARSLTAFRQALYFQNIGFNMYDVMIYEKTGSGPPHPGRYFNAFEYMFVLSKGKPKTIHLLQDKPNKWGGQTSYGTVTRREKDGTITDKGKKTIQKFGVRTNIWSYCNSKGFSTSDEEAYGHPAIFPEKLAEDHIRCWSDEGDVVLDPFGGSGTTAKMAQKLGRKWIMIEKVENYCEIARMRMDRV